ncbi:hypothetical protein C5B85_15290 [Pseudoclavibacter sp. AY1F1]|uniref:DUF6301 family protein n=1 Tax=Pseudoclavibacter sp. AY1F1 TaxID=2080583 RepID=UPI000CE799F0|nr:DUF6301 family protein [Pseudoclavibacter sp. AY1F1]PPF42928.1 hypothetical protein C5B85_15290 [Pseudoclavibacter sp. AY1F1]
MTTQNIAGRSTVARLSEVLTGLSWPVSKQELTGVAAALGWSEARSTSRSARYRTGYIESPERVSNASASVKDESVTEIQVKLSGADASGAADVAGARRQLGAELAEILGEGAARQGSDIAWDLDNGGRLWLKSLDTSVALIALQPAYAEIERREERSGISPDRVPGEAI